MAPRKPSFVAAPRAPTAASAPTPAPVAQEEDIAGEDEQPEDEEEVGADIDEGSTLVINAPGLEQPAPTLVEDDHTHLTDSVQAEIAAGREAIVMSKAATAAEHAEGRRMAAMHAKRVPHRSA